MNSRQVLGTLFLFGLILVVGASVTEPAVAGWACAILDHTDGGTERALFTLPKTEISDLPDLCSPGPDCAWTCTGNISDSTRSIHFNRMRLNPTAFFTDPWADGIDGDQCFEVEGPEGEQYVLGNLRVAKRRKSSYADGTLWLHGYASDGTTEVLYGMELEGQFLFPENSEAGPGVDCPGDGDQSAQDFWPPPQDCTVYAVFTYYNMHPDAKGKLKNDSCRGAGELIRPIVVAIHRSIQ